MADIDEIDDQGHSTLLDAACALEDLAGGRMPSQKAVLLGLYSLDKVLLRGSDEQLLQDAASTLELFVATGGEVSDLAEARARYALMAAAVRGVAHD